MLINFARGHPNPSLLPIDAMKEALILLREQSNFLSCLPYPSQDQDNGSNLFRQQLSLFLAQHTERDDHGHAASTRVCGSNDFFATHGVSHAVELLCGTLTQPGDIVGIEIPTYFLVGRIFENHGLKLQPLPMKDFRLDVATLETKLKSGEFPVPRLLYTIPTNHNPTASTLPVDDRIQLAQLAEDYGFTVIADEVYHLLDWSTKRPARMAEFNSPSAGTGNFGCCVSISSFTKIFCPGIRCGWIEAPPRIIAELKNYGYIRSQGGCVPFVGELMRLVLESGLATQVLTNLQASYQHRSTLLCDILQEENIRVCVRPSGGFFVWIELPVDNVVDFSQYSLDHGVKFLPGVSCDHFGGADCAPYGRLCFADLTLADLEQGARKFGSILREFNANH
jgi:2-aminoadipate transaminase